MKRLGIIGTVVLAGCYVARVSLAQHGMQHMGHEGMQMQEAQGVKLDVRDDAARQILTVRFGRLELPAHLRGADALNNGMYQMYVPQFVWAIHGFV